MPGRQNFCLFCLPHSTFFCLEGKIFACFACSPFFFVLLPSTCGRWFGHNIFFHQPTAMSFEPPHPAFEPEPEPEPPCPSSHPPLQRTFSQANSVASADVADDLFQFPMEGLELPCTHLVSFFFFFFATAGTPLPLPTATHPRALVRSSHPDMLYVVSPQSMSREWLAPASFPQDAVAATLVRV